MSTRPPRRPLCPKHVGRGQVSSVVLSLPRTNTLRCTTGSAHPSLMRVRDLMSEIITGSRRRHMCKQIHRTLAARHGAYAPDIGMVTSTRLPAVTPTEMLGPRRCGVAPSHRLLRSYRRTHRVVAADWRVRAGCAMVAVAAPGMAACVAALHRVRMQHPGSAGSRGQ
eukprot:365031-Chlamydomonas_euryale.AAC.5